MHKKMALPLVKIFGIPSKYKWEKSLNEWMGLGAKTTAYLLSNYGEEAVVKFWDFNNQTMVPFWKKQNIKTLEDFTTAMIFLSEVTNTKIKILKKEKDEAEAMVIKCGFKEAVENYRELVEVPCNFPCSQWCRPFWTKISSSLGFNCSIKDDENRCRFLVKISDISRH